MFKDLLDKFRKNKVPVNLVSELMSGINRLPVSFKRGQGSLLWDVDDNEYLDAFASDGVALLGHSHPQISEVLSLQAAQLIHSGAQFHNKEQADLAAKLCDISGMHKVVFAQTLAEANSAAISLICAQAHSKHINSPVILSTNADLHRCSGLSKSTDIASVHSSRSETRLQRIETVSVNSIDDLGKHAGNAEVAAVFIETVSSDDLVELAEADFLRAVRELCNEHDWLMVVDESRTCMGRTGDWFNYQNADVLPDIVVAADALANGIPLAVCGAVDDLGELLEPGDHMSAYGGNQLASRCSRALIDVLSSENLLATVVETGEYLKRQLQHRIGTLNTVRKLCNQGLFITIELDKCYPNLATKFLLQGLVVGVNHAENTIYLVPALNLTQDQALSIARKVCLVLESI